MLDIKAVPTKELRDLVTKAATAYYNSDLPIMSDEEFDALVAELAERGDSLATETSFGADLESTHLEKMLHGFPQYNMPLTVSGLNKVRYRTLMEWAINEKIARQGIMSSKLDGISAVAYYEGGKLQRVLTRGDGHSGLNIINNLPSDTFPQYLETEDTEFLGPTWVRGEVVVRLGSHTEHGYSTERNMAAGLANTKEPTELNKLLRFVAYDTSLDGNYAEKLDWLSKLGFEVVKHYKYDVDDYKTIAMIDHLLNYSTHDVASRYLVDGVVYRSLDNGSSDTYAIKFFTKLYETEVVKVHYQLSDKGRLIPVIQYNPVTIDGTVCTFCSGFNFKQILDNGIGPGAIIKVTKANEVIPHWAETVKSAEVEYPTDISYYTDGVHLRVAKSEADYLHVSLLNLMRLKAPLGLAGAGIDYIINQLQVDNLAKFRDATPLLDPQGKVQILYNQLVANKDKGFTLQELIESLNLDGVGWTNAKHLAEFFHNEPEHLLEATSEDIDSVPGLNTPARESIKSYLELIKQLIQVGFKVAYPQVENPVKYKVALTGKLSKPRNKLLEDWAPYGVKEVAIGECQYLITDNPEGDSSKLKSARAKKIKILSEADFLSLIQAS